MKPADAIMKELFVEMKCEAETGRDVTAQLCKFLIGGSLLGAAIWQNRSTFTRALEVSLVPYPYPIFRSRLIIVKFRLAV
jgi:hypothetical protein